MKLFSGKNSVPIKSQDKKPSNNPKSKIEIRNATPPIQQRKKYDHMIFIWNEANAIAHFKKHKISFEEAVIVFDDPYAITFSDNRHGKPRFTRIGRSDAD